MEQWYYAQAREKAGPVSREQLVEFLTTGVITPGSLVWTNTMEEWIPAIQVPGLMARTPAPEPELPTPPAAATAATVPSTTPTPLATDSSGLPEGASPWEQLEARADLRNGSSTEALDGDAETPKSATLTFSSKRRKPKHKRAGARIKTLVVRTAALVIALGIGGGGGYLGAQYLGLLDEPVAPRLRYLPDSPDYVFTINVPKVMSVAQSSGADTAALMGATSVPGLPLDLASIQDVTVAGNLNEKRWIMVATLSKPMDVKKMFPGGKEPESTRVGGTKIYYDRSIAQYGLDFAVATPSKSTMIIGPYETLKGVLKRRGAPVLAPGFMPLLDARNSDAWIAGAADVDALWRTSGDSLPENLTEEQRWLAQSVGSIAFSMRGNTEYDFELTAQCKNPKDAPLLVAKAKEAIEAQRKVMLEMLHSFGQPVGQDTKTPLDGIKVTATPNGMLTIQQHIDKSMLELGTHQLAAAGLMQP